MFSPGRCISFHPKILAALGITLLYWLPAIATASLIAWLSHQSSLPDLPGPFEIPDWVAHILEYGFFELTLVFAITRGFEASTRTMVRVAASVTIASLYGITDEWHQSFTFGRDASVWDWTADTVGAVLAGSMVIGIWRRMAALQLRV